MDMTVRRLVTGTADDGSAVFAIDEQLKPIVAEGAHPEAGFWPIWGANATVGLPVGGTTFDFDSVFPPPGGFRCFVGRIPPDAAAAQSPNPGGQMHKTATVDILVILEGEVWLEIEG